MTVQATELLPSIFAKLSVEGFLSAPVCEGSTLVGQITMLDLVKHVNGLFYATTEEEWTDWFEKQLMFQTTPANTLMEEPSEYNRCPYKTLNEHFTSFSALELMARDKHHQILLTDSSDEKKLCGIITQSMLISFLRQNKAKWGAEFSKLKVKDFKRDDAIKGSLQCVYEDELAINAFLRMEENDVHGLPIIDHSGVLKGCISVRDLRGCGTDGSKFYRLYRSVQVFKDLVRTEHKNLAPATHYSRESVPLDGVFVTPEDSMETVITKMKDGNLHRLFICSKASADLGLPKPIGVVSQSDVLLQTLDHIITSVSGGQAKPRRAATEQRLTARKVSPRGRKEPAKATTVPQRASPSGKRSIQIM